MRREPQPHPEPPRERALNLKIGRSIEVAPGVWVRIVQVRRGSVLAGIRVDEPPAAAQTRLDNR